MRRRLERSKAIGKQEGKIGRKYEKPELHDKQVLEGKSSRIVSPRRLHAFLGSIANRRTEDVMKLLSDPDVSQALKDSGSFYGISANLVADIISDMKKDGKEVYSALRMRKLVADAFSMA